MQSVERSKSAMMLRRNKRSGAKYDVVVIGSGLGGLTASAILAKYGLRVLVLEQHSKPGGCAQAFRRKKYLFDSAVHLISGCATGGRQTAGLIDALLSLLDIKALCQMVRIDPFYTAIFPGCRFEIPLGVEKFIAAHSALFPEEQEGIGRFVRLAVQAAEIVKRLPVTKSLPDAFRQARRFPEILKYQRVTYQVVMDQHIKDPHLKALLSSIWPYCGLPPSRVSFLQFALLLMSYIIDGAYHCRGSFQNLADALVAALRKNGGELLTREKVDQIQLEHNAVSGVKLANGDKIPCSVVISNADAKQTFNSLIGADHIPIDYKDRLNRMQSSISAFIVYTAMKADMRGYNAKHEMLFYDSWDHDQTFRELSLGQPSIPIVTIPTLSDDTLASPGHHLLTILQIVPFDLSRDWSNFKPKFTDRLLEKIERHFAGIRSRMVHIEAATPATVQRYTLNRNGAMYGWEAIPTQTGSRRLGHQTPVKGLLLAGHWSQPGSGVYSVVQSGLHTAQIVLGYDTTDELFRALGGDSEKMKIMTAP